jgi:hypothetical protein
VFAGSTWLPTRMPTDNSSHEASENVAINLATGIYSVEVEGQNFEIDLQNLTKRERAVSIATSTHCKQTQPKPQRPLIWKTTETIDTIDAFRSRYYEVVVTHGKLGITLRPELQDDGQTTRTVVAQLSAGSMCEMVIRLFSKFICMADDTNDRQAWFMEVIFAASTVRVLFYQTTRTS